MPPKYTLQIDRLTVSLSLNTESIFSYNYIKKNFPHTGNSFTLNPTLELRKVERYDKYYTYSFEVWSGVNKIGLLHTDSRLPQTEKLVKFELAKSVLYSKTRFLYCLQQLQNLQIIEDSQKIKDLQQPQKVVGLYVETISYLEIALDIQLQKPLLPRLSHIERHSTLDKHNPAPKFRPLRAKTLVSKLANGKEYVFGDKRNGKTIAIYNKTDSLAETEETFITQFHELNGLDTSKPVERIEARIHSKWFAANKLAVDEHDLTQHEKLKTLFIRAVGDCFKFVDINTPEKPKRNAQGNYTLPVKDLLPLGFIQNQPATFTERWQVGEDAEVSDNRKRTAYRVLVDAYITQGAAEALESLRYYEITTKPPKGQTWQHLASRYAQRFEGHPTAENKARIESLSAYCLPIY